jgi:hypothetical protein
LVRQAFDREATGEHRTDLTVGSVLISHEAEITT